MSPNQHFCSDYSQRRRKKRATREGERNLLPSEGKAVSIHMHCLVNFARGVDSSWSISSDCIFILLCNLLLSVKCEARTTIRALEQARPINSADVWCVQQEAITSQRHGAYSFQGQRLIWVSDFTFVNNHQCSLKCGPEALPASGPQAAGSHPSICCSYE